MQSFRQLAKQYRESHNFMRNIDGLQPQEAFDELLKYLFFKQAYETYENVKNFPTIKEVKSLFKEYLGKANSWSDEIWRDKKFYLSDECLLKVHELLFPINFTSLNYDIRSHALKEFLTPEIRKGLGIFLTPDDVVKAIIEYLEPCSNDKILDPACGSGTFLIEYLKKIKTQEKTINVFGYDKNPKMLLLADLNLNHVDNTYFNKKLLDSIKNTPQKKGEFDLITTNPPFGMIIDSRYYDLSNYETCKDKNGYILKSQGSEIVFIEKCFQLLKPSGELAVVIPKSIATNNTLQLARNALSKYGYIYTIMSLPPETFASTGTQLTTIVLFARKFLSQEEKDEKINVYMSKITNVGFDATGRSKAGNQLPDFTQTVSKAKKSQEPYKNVTIIYNVRKSDTFPKLADFFINQISSFNGIPLGELCEVICTGKTPARQEYVENGYFLIKVGNLSGTGINWNARDRNFISHEEIEKRKNAKRELFLREYDILLTASAHNSMYIAKKSDMFIKTPTFIKDSVSFVGEIMLLRPNLSQINPYLLLAFLRHPQTISSIQSLVRGQTAHLHADDLRKLTIPKTLLENNSSLTQVAELLKKQVTTNNQLNEITHKQYDLLDQIIIT